jgi:type 1 glutamine amidotransferase
MRVARGDCIRLSFCVACLIVLSIFFAATGAAARAADEGEGEAAPASATMPPGGAPMKTATTTQATRPSTAPTQPEQPTEAKLKALIIDGQNNHDWKATTAVLKSTLETSGRFTVDVATTPQDGKLDAFKPDFGAYDVVVSNYNGAAWPEPTRKALEQYVAGGGGFVVVHAADNAFPDWPEYNKMIGLGGWNGRDEKAGPSLRYRDGRVIKDTSPGPGGMHGAVHAYLVETRQTDHPIVSGLPEKWLHAPDELYGRLRGPADHVTVLATAWSAKEKGGTGEHEPVLFTVDYGKGRVFHTVMGHDVGAMRCVGFMSTFQRGAEWAATGKVTIKKPDDFPTAEKVSQRDAK